MKILSCYTKAGVTMTCINYQQKGHNKKGCKNTNVVLPPKPTCKKGKSRKTLVVGSSLRDEDIDTLVVDEPVVEEQASDFNVESSSQFDVGGSSQFVVGGSSDVRGSKKNDVGGSGYFDDGGSSDVRGCGQFGVRREQEPQAAEQEPHAGRARRILNFIIPRLRSERILKKQLAKKVHEIGSTSLNSLNLE
ncbi:hypothetical protein Tco_1065245 [Tanacetum coccineum]